MEAMQSRHEATIKQFERNLRLIQEEKSELEDEISSHNSTLRREYQKFSVIWDTF